MATDPGGIEIRRSPDRYLKDVTGPGRDWVLDHPIIDLAVVVLAVVAYRIWGASGSSDVIAHIPSAHRLIIYGALATVATLAAGTTNAAIAAYLNSGGTKVDDLHARQGGTIRKNFRSITVWLWTAAVLSIVALLIDIDGTARHSRGLANGAQYLFVVGFAIIILKFARLTFLQDLLLRVWDADAVISRRR